MASAFPDRKEPQRTPGVAETSFGPEDDWTLPAALYGDAVDFLSSLPLSECASARAQLKTCVNGRRRCRSRNASLPPLWSPRLQRWRHRSTKRPSGKRALTKPIWKSSPLTSSREPRRQSLQRTHRASNALSPHGGPPAVPVSFPRGATVRKVEAGMERAHPGEGTSRRLRTSQATVSPARCTGRPACDQCGVWVLGRAVRTYVGRASVVAYAAA